MPTRQDLEKSPALSILLNGPESFKGRKIGVLVSDGVDDELLKGLQAAAKAEGAMVKIVAPMVGGVTTSGGTLIEGDEKVDGGPSVVFDAVAVLLSDEGAATLAKEPTAKDFVTDAFAHCKFIAYSPQAMKLFEKAGIASDLDEGCVKLGSGSDAAGFVEMCRKVRHWPREPMVKAV